MAFVSAKQYTNNNRKAQIRDHRRDHRHNNSVYILNGVYVSSKNVNPLFSIKYINRASL